MRLLIGFCLCCLSTLANLLAGAWFPEVLLVHVLVVLGLWALWGWVAFMHCDDLVDDWRYEAAMAGARMRQREHGQYMLLLSKRPWIASGKERP